MDEKETKVFNVAAKMDEKRVNVDNVGRYVPKTENWMDYAETSLDKTDKSIEINVDKTEKSVGDTRTSLDKKDKTAETNVDKREKSVDDTETSFKKTDRNEDRNDDKREKSMDDTDTSLNKTDKSDKIETNVDPKVAKTEMCVKEIETKILESGKKVEETEANLAKKRTSWFLYFCSVVANLFLFSTGNILAWNSPVLPKLLSNDTEVNPFGEPITIFQESLIIGLVPFGTLIGAGIVGKIPDLIGRRKTLIYLATIQLSCFVVIGFATHVYVYISFIALMVMSNVAATIVVPIYTTEISEDHNRGKLGCIVSVAIASGQFYGYLVGPLTSIRIFAFLCVIPLVMFLLLCWFIPETPIYSVLKSDKSNALANLQRLRKSKKSIEIEEEYAKIEESIESKLNKESKVNFFDLFKSHAGKKAFLLALIVRVLQYSSGIYIITSFLGTFLDEAGGSISGHSLAVAVAAGKICASFVTVNVIERLGRRLLLLVGSGICGTSMFVLAVHFFLKSNDIPLPEYLRYMPVIAVIFFVTANIFGLNAVAFIVIAELLPSEFRAVGTSVVLMICAVINICITFAYSYVVEYLGMHYAMCTFGIIAFVGFSLVFKFLPETKGKSFSDIKKMLE